MRPWLRIGACVGLVSALAADIPALLGCCVVPHWTTPGLADQYDLVAVAIVSKVEKTSASTNVVLKVEAGWKGVKTPTLKVPVSRLSTAYHGFVRNTTYVLFLTRTRDGSLSTSCSPIARIESLQLVIDTLGIPQYWPEIP